jgi:hypothetical protein
LGTLENGIGFIEASQRLSDISERRWDARQLLAAVDAGQLHNTGWPMGVVLDTGADKPRVTEDGIEFRLRRDVAEGSDVDWEDSWSFRKDGNFYLARVFEEEYSQLTYSSSEKPPDRQFWFDLRIRRIAEAILHSASLYRALGIPPDELYLLHVGHHGLAEREFISGDPSRYVRRGSVSHVSAHSWSKEVSGDFVTANLASLTNDVCVGLFEQFDFQSVSSSAVQSIVDDFLNRRR